MVIYLYPQRTHSPLAPVPKGRSLHDFGGVDHAVGHLIGPRHARSQAACLAGKGLLVTALHPHVCTMVSPHVFTHGFAAWFHLFQLHTDHLFAS